MTRDLKENPGILNFDGPCQSISRMRKKGKDNKGLAERKEGKDAERERFLDGVFEVSETMRMCGQQSRLGLILDEDLAATFSVDSSEPLCFNSLLSVLSISVIKRSENRTRTLLITQTEAKNSSITIAIKPYTVLILPEESDVSEYGPTRNN